MLQRYKLRLGDGTVLLVDHDGLGTWLVDNKATVQAGGSRNWVPLRKFLARERAVQARRARQEAAAWSALPSDIPPRRADGLPLTPPPPRTPPPGGPPPREDGLPLVPPPPPRESDTPPESTPAPREDGLPLVPPPSGPEEEAPPDPPAAVPFGAEPAPEALAPVALQEEAPSPEPIAVVAAPADQGPLVVPPPDDAPAPLPAEVGGSIPQPVDEVWTPPVLDPPPPLSSQAPDEPNPVVMPDDGGAVPLAVALVDESPSGPPASPEPEHEPEPGLTTPVEDETTIDLSSFAQEVTGDAAVAEAPAPSEPEQEVAPEPEAPVRVTVGAPLVMRSRPEESVPLDLPPLPGASVVATGPPISLASQPGEAPQVTGLDGSAVPQGRAEWDRSVTEEPPARPVEDVTALPVVPLKPLGEQHSTPRARRESSDLWTGAPDVDTAGPPLSLARPGFIARLDLSAWLGEGFWSRGRTASVHRVLASLGAFFSRCLAPINRLERGQALFPAETARKADDAPGSAPVVEPSVPTPPLPSTPVRPLADDPDLVAEDAPEGLPIVPLKIFPLKIFEDDEGPSETGPGASQKILARAKGWLDKPAAWASRLTETAPSPAPPAEVVSTRARTPPPGEMARPPLPVTALPVVPLADAVEPAMVEDVYEDDLPGGLAEATWLWTKRLLMVTALGGAAFVAFSTWESWSEPAAEIGQTTLTEIDGHVRTLDLIRQRQEAVAKVGPELPHLSPERVRHLMVLSPIGLLDAKGVFEAAWVAAERGAPRLPPDHARELEAVQTELQGGLFPAERDWIRDFDRARFRGAVFPFDAQQAHIVYARGVRRLPVESQETLRRRLDEAIALGLEPGEEEPVAAD